MSNTARGLWPLLGYAALTAAVDVYAGNRLQSLSPISVAAISFSLAAVFFLALEVAGRGVAAVRKLLWTQRHDVTAINVTTAATWLTLLYALKYLEPAIVNVVALAIGPALTMLLSPLLRRGSSVLRIERVISVGVLIVIGVLMWWSAVGLTGIRVDGDQAALGLVLTLLCGLACTGNVIYSKRLSDGGMTPQSSLAVRYFLMIAICWSLVAMSDGPRWGVSFVPGAVIAVIGVALPMYLGQVGIKHVEPITASLLETLSPVCAFLLQLLDGRLRPSGYSLAGILAITALVAVGVVARSRHERALTSPSQEQPPVRAAPTLSGGASIRGEIS
jgi:drug/metabolite transporter (DMT)-like permease